MRSWWKVGSPQGADQFGIDLCRCHGFYFETNGRGWGRVMSPFPFGLGAYKSLVVRSNSCRAWCAGLPMQEFSHSNAWTTLTHVPPKSFVGLSVQAGHWAGAECSQCQSQSRDMNTFQLSKVGVWCCAIHNATIVKLKTNNGTVQHEECVCPLPISSERPLGWGWEPPCTVSSAHWCVS